jgi:uncharacterized repeat protein (TIGR01451 family)/uncharacterized repeat protein (TIGR02543 family)
MPILERMGRRRRFPSWRRGALVLRAFARSRPVRAAAFVCAVAAVGLALSGAASFASGPALTVTPISWTVVGLDSNSPSTASLPHIYPLGARVCNTGTDPATNVSAKWTWGDTTGTNSIDQAFNGPAQNTPQTVGTLAGGSCEDVYFNVDVKQSGGNSSKTHSQNQNIIVTGDGGLSVTETKLVYVESLVSQNRNTVKGWTGPGGCNLTYSVCDPAPTHIYVGQQYTFKLYAQTATAYDELEAFATWPSFITLNSATSTYSTISSPGSSTSSSIWADSCTWGSMTSSSSGACSSAGKAGGKTVVTYKITPTSAGTATAIQPMIYDHSGSSFHYNSGFTTSLEAVEADWKLSATVVGDGMVTSSPNGFRSTGASAAISCGTSGTTCDVGYANNTSVTLTAAPGSGQTFTGWSGGSCSGTATTCVVTMNQARSVTATFSGTTHYPLVATKYGSGTVTAGDTSISCGSTCRASYASGTSVTLTAAASTGWKFTGWSGDCATSGTSPTCIVTMSQARNVTATFDEQTYTLTVSATGTGAGDLCSNNSNQSNAGLCSPGSEAVFISCGSSTSTTNYTDTICTGTYPSGQSATLYPMCNGGSAGTPCPGGSGASTVTFGGYTGGTCSGSATSGCAFTMDQDRTVSANFVLGNTATPDLTVSKSHVGNFSQGDTGKTYTLTVSNVGTGAGYTGKTITVTDAPPTGLTITAMSGTGWTCTVATKSCTQTLASNISAGGSLNPITVTVSVAANASTPLINAATVACASSCTNDTSNDTASDSTTILTPADLTLTKSHSGNFTQGATGDWTLAVTNSGGQPTSGAVTVTDALPTGFTKNAVSGTGWDCSASTATNISCTRSDALASGSSYPAITVTANVGATAVTSTNTASVSGGGETNTSNDSASDPTTMVAHLTVATAGNGSGTVTDDLSSINCGSTCSADYATGTAVTLTATPGTSSTFTGWSGDIGSCTATATTCQVTMNQARSITATFTLQTFTLQITTSGAGTGTVTSDVGGISCNANTGTCSKTYDYGTTVTLSEAADGGSTFSGWSGGCTVSGATCVATMTQSRSVGAAFDLGTSPFLSVSKSHTGSFRQGDTGDQYTISVSNTGTAATSGLVTVTDTVPAGLTPTAATGTGWHKSDGSGTDTCSILGQTVTCTRTDALAASGTYPSITVSVDVSATAASSVTNSASVSGGGCSSSPCSSTSDPTTVVQNPRLTVAKSHTGNFSQSDPNDTYTITVSNGSGTEVGPTSGTVTVSDTVPAGLTPTAATGTGWHTSDGSATDTCSVSGQTVTCTRTDVLARGASYPDITVSVSVAVDAPASVTNTASVSGGGCTTSPCGTASDPTTIVQNARLSISKTHTGSFHQGETGDQYTITVSNGSGTEVGPTSGTVTVSDTVPAGLTPTAAAGSGWHKSDGSGTNTCSVSGQVVTCTRSDVLPAGSSYSSITVVVDVAADAPSSLTNSVSVSGGGCASAPCGSASDPTTVVQDPRLAISKTHTGSFHQGDTGDQYTITVSNGSGTEVGPTTGTVTVSDTVPTGLTPTAATGTGWHKSDGSGTDTCSVSGQVVTCTRTDVLARGGSYPAITLSVDVAADAPSSVTNSASVSGGGCTVSPCSTASDPTTIVPNPRLSLTKTHTGSFHQGDTGDQYTITVSNGSGTEVGPTSGTVTVSDTVPTGLTPTAATGTGWHKSDGTGTNTCSVSGQVVTCTRTDVLARGGSYPAITVSVDVAVDALASITNSASVSGGGCVAPCGSASDPTTVVQDPRLAVAKTHTGSFHQRDTGDQYTITAANGSGTEVGPTTGTVTVSDTVPAGLTPTAATGTGWHKSDGSGTDTCSVSGQVVTCTRTDVLARGGSYPAITVSVDVAVDAPASVTNSASVAGGGCVSPCGSASDPTTIVQDPRLSITKTHTGSFRQRETGDTYTITITNGSGTEVGPTTGTVTVTDTVPTGLTPTGAGGTGWHKSDGSGTDICSVSGQVVTCTRTDVLARAGSYPAITVSVDVASNAPGSVTNSASLAGGGCVSPCGSTTDPTTIIARYDLSASTSGTGSGTVTSDVGTISCGATCVNTYDDGTVVTLTANVASGTTFLGWSGDCSGTSSTCQVTMSQARSVSAAFGRPNLDLTKVADDTLHQGDTGRRYTISVKNIGDGPTTSTVTVTENPPTGLTVTGLSGMGWTCSVPALTCTRSDALAPGSSYPDITVVVSVAVNADPTVTNSATVGGGGCSASPCDVSTAPAPVDQTGGSISGRVSEDKPGSPGLQGWTVVVDRNDNGNLDSDEQSGTTNANGDYTISGLAGGSYRVREVANGAWTCSQPTPCSYSRTLASGGSSSGNDFANWLPGSIAGTVYDDSTGHSPLADWTVYLDLNGNGAPDSGEPTSTTGANGRYSFSSLARGHYTVREITANGWTCSTPQPCTQDVTIESGSAVAGRDFGNTQPRGSASASGTVYNDLNADGTRQSGEPGLQGWRVFIDLNGDGRLDAGDLSARTGADGGYSISRVSPGTYTIFEVIPEDGWKCSDPSPCSRSVTFSTASSVGGLDFGNWAHALLRGHKFEDANRDGVHQASESPLGGWTIYVDYNDNSVLDPGEPSSVTLPNGNYGITGIAAGTWSVREVGQPDWTCSAPAGCAHRITFTPDSEVDGKDFLNWAPARVTGHVWDDLEVDDVRDANEPRLPGWIVYVDYNGNGKLDAGDISTVTDVHGNYSIGVKPGKWLTREIRPEHWICNFPTPCAQTFTFASGSTMSGDFGNYRLALLSGTMFNDLNRDGGQDPGEPGLGGWQVYVDYNANGRWDHGEPFDVTSGGVAGFRTLSSVHGVPGHYTITGIEPGNWPIREIRKSGFPCTVPFTCEYTQRFLEDSRIHHRDFATFKPLVTGRATLTVPDMCVADTFMLRLIGSAIQRVDLSIAPGKHRLLRGRWLKHETLAKRIDAAAMGVGPHRVFAQVFFTKASGTAPKRLSAVFYRCAPVAPPFTG